MRDFLARVHIDNKLLTRTMDFGGDAAVSALVSTRVLSSVFKGGSGIGLDGLSRRSVDDEAEGDDDTGTSVWSI